MSEDKLPLEEIKGKYGEILTAREHVKEVRSKLQSNSLDNGDWFYLEKDYTKHERDFIERTQDEIEEKYKKINPELASLREEEKNKVENGMNPKQAQKERREAVKAYYNKKSQIEK